MDIAIVGAGFSGLLLALHLLRRSASTRIVLIERSPTFGRGLAYGAADPDHLLNVRASNMSAFPDEPDHFVRWLEREAPSHAAEGFAPRRLFGTYLQSLLREAIAGPSGADRLLLVGDEVVALSPGARMSLTLALGRRIEADLVVLATGNLPPHDAPGLAADVAGSDRYVRDPWAPHALSIIRPEEDVLLIGSGLTAADIALKLAARGHRGRIVSLSRRGLRSRAHRDGAPPARPYDVPSKPALSDLLHLVRERAADGDWRTAVDGLRAGTQRLWREADDATRRRFLRHLQPWWMAHRHRLAPSPAATLDALEASGQFAVRGGSVNAVRLGASGLEVDWRPRRAAVSEVLHVARLINCTGPAGDLAGTRSPLLNDLVANGMARPDARGLGLDVDADCRVIDVGGLADPRLLAVGPMSRGAFWEITAVPDIRVQAAALAERLAGFG